MTGQSVQSTRAVTTPTGRYDAAFSVVGHAGPVRILTAALAAGQVPHGYLFYGPQGVGKATVAHAFARTLLCTAEGARPCGACASCHRVDHGGGFELLRLVPDGARIKVEQVRELQDLMRTGGDRGVVLIDPADALGPEAANALLKTLEEPPGGWSLVLVSSRPEALLPTIRSRCQAVRFGPLSPADTGRVLEAAGVAADLLPFLTMAAQGAPGRLLDADVSPEELREEYVRAIEALAPEALKSPDAVFSTAEAWGRDAAVTRRFLHWALLWISAALAGAESAEPDLPSPAVWRRAFADGDLAALVEKLHVVEERLERNINRQSALEDVLVTLRTACRDGAGG